MKKRLAGLVLVGSMLLSLPGEATAKLYGNARFGYFINVPSQFTVTDPEPENGDGLTFHPKDRSADLAVFGGWISENDFAAEVESRAGYETQDGWRLTYQSKVSAHAANFSGQKGDRIFYEHFVPSCNGKAFATYRLEYPATEKAKYDLMIKSLNASLRAGEGSCN